jgi:hypothetical protein
MKKALSLTVLVALVVTAAVSSAGAAATGKTQTR